MIIQDIVNTFDDLTKSFSTSLLFSDKIGLLNTSFKFLSSKNAIQQEDVIIPLGGAGNKYEIDYYLNLQQLDPKIYKKMITVNKAIDDEGMPRPINNNVDGNGVMLLGSDYVKINRHLRDELSPVSLKDVKPSITLNIGYTLQVAGEITENDIAMRVNLPLSDSLVIPVASYMAYNASFKLKNSDENYKKFLYGNYNEFIKNQKENEISGNIYEEQNYIQDKGFI